MTSNIDDFGLDALRSICDRARSQADPNVDLASVLETKILLGGLADVVESFIAVAEQIASIGHQPDFAAVFVDPRVIARKQCGCDTPTVNMIVNGCDCGYFPKVEKR